MDDDDDDAFFGDIDFDGLDRQSAGVISGEEKLSLQGKNLEKQSGSCHTNESDVIGELARGEYNMDEWDVDSEHDNTDNIPGYEPGYEDTRVLEVGYEGISRVDVDLDIYPQSPDNVIEEEVIGMEQEENDSEDMYRDFVPSTAAPLRGKVVSRGMSRGVSRGVSRGGNGSDSIEDTRFEKEGFEEKKKDLRNDHVVTCIDLTVEKR